MPPLPAADAVTVMGPPTARQVAIPVFGSMDATFESDDAHCTGKLD